MAVPILANFVAGNTGAWGIEWIAPVHGEVLPAAPRLAIVEDTDAIARAPAAWRLRGSTAHAQYTTRREVEALGAVQQGLGRPAATRAAMIPIRKSAAWWDLAQDERRVIFEESSRHIAIGLDYLPAIARRLYHCRAFAQPFDFVTWFEYAPEHAGGFEELVRRLRATPEWRYVEREVDIRLSRIA